MSEEQVQNEQREKVVLENPGRLGKHYVWNNLERVFAIVFLVLSVSLFGVSIASLASALFMVIYVLIIFCISAFVVIFTLGLIFTIEDNIVVKMWAVLQNFDIKTIEQFQYRTLPGLAISSSIFLVGALLLLLLNRGNLKKLANIILISASGLFYLIGIFITIMMYSSK